MATTLASLVVKIGADVTGVTAGMNTLEKRSRRLKKQFSSVTDSTLRWQSALGVLAGAAGLGFAAKRIFDLGAGIEETSSKFNTVFGPSVEGAQKFLDEFANSTGLTNTAGQELLATTGAIVQGMGMSQSASAAFAEEIVRLSGDLTSFNNIPIAEVSRTIQTALTGEREGLKRLGINLLETDVQKQALMMTGKEHAKALTQEEKATATLALITKRAGVAVGDLARTMESPSNRARTLTASILDVRNAFATALLPSMVVILEELEKVAGSEGFTGLSEKIKNSSAVIAAWAKFTVESFKTIALAIAAPVRIAFNLGQVIGKTLTAAAQAMTGNFEGARATLASMVGDFGDMKMAITNVIDGFDDMRIASGAAWSTVTTSSPPATAAVTDYGTAAGVAAAQQAALNDELSKTPSLLSKLSGFLGGLGALGGVLGLAVPGLGQATGLLSAFNSFRSLSSSGGSGAGDGGRPSQGPPPGVLPPASQSQGGGNTPVVVNVIGSDLRALVSDVTVIQGRNADTRHVGRVPVPA